MMIDRRFLRLLLLVLLLLFVLPTTAQPAHDGELEIAGLNDTVEILRDEWGVPHIYASNSYDLFFAQGYTQAQDRWWQMEFSRHTARGSIQELTGRNDGLMGTDVFLRTLGFRDVAERELAETYGEEDIAILQAFADGVNAYILTNEPGDLAFEYTALGLQGIEIEIEPWTPVDTIIWGKVMALSLSGNQSRETLLSRIMAALDETLVDAWFPAWPYGEKPTIVMPEDIPLSEETLSAPAISDMMTAGIIGLETELVGGFTDEDMAQVGLPMGDNIGSNNWVAHGDITESGMPLMANDMHLGLEMPSIWYEIGLHCQPVGEDCPYDVVGFTFAPSVAVTAGHNANIAWAHTNVGPDTQDLYQIRVNPENELQYEWDGEFRDMTLREEVLNFGDGSEPLTFQVRMTHLGPIINDSLDGFNNENPLALRWTALEPGTLLKAINLLNRAENWDDFREALSFWDTPSQNIIYADIEGNIGYQTPGNIPIRAAEHSGLLPVPGWMSDFEWLGYIPYDSLPRIWNPDRGFVATANQALVPLEFYDMLADELGDEFGEDANYQISQQWAYGYRGDRINTLLEELAPHNADTFAQIHGDNYDGSAAEIMPYLAELEIDDAEMAEMRDWLLEWDFQTHMDSAHAPLYANFWVRLMDNLYNDQLEGVTRAGGNGNYQWGTFLLMEEPDHAWWNDVTTEDTAETRDEILLRSFTEGVAATLELLGEDREAWRWGDIHTITFVSNPLGLSGVEFIENRVNRGPFAVSGTGNAVNAMGWSTSSGDFTTRSGPSERAIYDLSNWDNSLTIHPTGQSGRPDSPHYDDMIDPWRNIEYKPMLWSREQVEAAAVSTLVLTPGR